MPWNAWNAVTRHRVAPTIHGARHVHIHIYICIYTHTQNVNILKQEPNLNKSYEVGTSSKKTHPY
jgi:hypothetical protein